jgi:RHS repeat-associated protein
LGRYFYDGDGKRVKKITDDETVIFVYDAGGKLIAEYSTQLSLTPQVAYLTSDHLGSPRINTDALGSVISRHDYRPFGEEIERESYSTDDIRKQFTGYERDKETDLDFAQARLYEKNHGRFTACDPIFTSKEHPVNPQRWNLYIYVINNPLSLIDPDGKKPKKVIDIFITYEQKSKEGREQWKKLQKDAKKNGVTVNIYRIDDKTATAAKFIESIKTPGRTTILVGHSMLDEQSTEREGRAVGKGLEFHDSAIVQAGYVGERGGKWRGLGGVNVQADVIAIFACDFGRTFSGLRSSNKTAFVYTNGGKDGESGTDSQNQAALRFATAIANGGSAEQARGAAREGFNTFRQQTDDDDDIEKVVMQPTKQNK